MDILIVNLYILLYSILRWSIGYIPFYILLVGVCVYILVRDAKK